MCGIFGVYNKTEKHKKQTVYNILVALANESETRGKEASGFCFANEKVVKIGKTSQAVSWLIKTHHFKDSFQYIFKTQNEFSFYFGHARLVTHGYEHFAKNNQPVQTNNIIIVHNGIVINYKQIWADYLSEIQPQTELDTEIIPHLYKKCCSQTPDIGNAIKNLFQIIKGTVNIALYESDTTKLILASNNGSLYYYDDPNMLVFASEKRILKNALNAGKFNSTEGNIYQIDTFKEFHTKSNHDWKFFQPIAETIDIDEIYKKKFINTSLEHTDNIFLKNEFKLHVQEVKNHISSLNRCVRCLLPQTFPGISFDCNGVCNICQASTSKNFKGKEHLANDLIKLSGGKPVLVAFSGGRDSSYTLHYIKKILGLNCIAYSFDWGMLTDLGRRNQSLMCAELNVEHILVSADIRKKRKNIRLNVEAWLKKPSLGMIPLFMAGDKQYFYHAYKVMQEVDANVLVMGENYLEKTGFKTAFSGAKQTNAGYMAYHISTANKFRMITYYLKQFLSNPSYINCSLLDTVGAAFSYYGLSHNYINLFNYIPWLESEVERVLIDQYNWETDPETQSTWRIGDGTAAFYNYIYFTVAGFTELDTFKSNQIREGLVSREEALRILQKENTPRWKSIKWYCDTIGIDFKNTIKRINQIPKLYLQ